jgi:hypothetical protein
LPQNPPWLGQEGQTELTSSFVFFGEKRDDPFFLKVDKELVAVEASGYWWGGRIVDCRKRQTDRHGWLRSMLPRVGALAWNCSWLL